MELASIITTCPRPDGVEQQYLEDALASICEAGFDEPAVSTDTERIGAYRAFKAAASWLIDNHPAAERLIVWQDDILVNPQLKDYLDRTKSMLGDFGCASLYTAECIGDPRFVGVWHNTDLSEERFCATKIFGACALMFHPQRLADFLLANIAPEEMQRTEVHVATWCYREGLDYIYRSDTSAVEHVGAVSSLENLFEKGCQHPQRHGYRFGRSLFTGDPHE